LGAGALRERIDVSQAGRRARRRVLDSLWAVLLAAIAASVAWYVAHRVLGHSEPFFAPIAAAISLSTSQIQRSRRIAQMVGGVLLGIVLAEGLSSLLGDGTAALGAVVLITMVVALAVGAGFFGDGMMFPNQATASAVLVVALHKHGTGSERAVDAIVGGVVAYVIGVGLFPAHPVKLVQNAEQRVLESLAGRLSQVLGLLREGGTPNDDWTLKTGFEIHQRLNGLARARATARVNVRVAPRRWRLRGAVAAEDRRTAQLDLLANAVLSLIRSLTASAVAEAAPPFELQSRVAQLAGALRGLSEAPRPWPDGVIQEAERAARAAIEYATARGVDREQVVAAILRATARDLIAVVDLDV
jgi:uncharacterized membrane protein YgaE (UPF0421/DUF939 family)